jgi:hypothetical protein
MFAGATRITSQIEGAACSALFLADLKIHSFSVTSLYGIENVLYPSKQKNEKQ